MATQNRGTRITKLLGQIKKQYKPVATTKDRPLLEHLLFACLLENSPHEAAEQAFERLKSEYVGWNEVRVSTKRELAETLKELNDPEQSAERLKRALHSVFESVYSYDLEHLKKQNLGQATKTIEKYEGTSPFTVAYVTQHALGGHAIPANQGLLLSFLTFDIISEKEAGDWHIPGLERAVPKTKGIETATILHQLGVEVGKNPYGTGARKLLVAIDSTCKARLPKKPEPPAPPKKKKKIAKKSTGDAKAVAGKKKKKAVTETTKPATKGSTEPTKKVKKKVAKKVAKKVKKKVPKKTAGGKKKATKKITKRKPK